MKNESLRSTPLMPAARVALLLGSLACLGCGAEGAGGVPTAAQSKEASAAPQSAGNTDDVVTEAKNPLVRGLKGMLGQLPLEDAESDLSDDLDQADDLLARAKRDNAEALRQANRQVRLRGHGSPNVLVIVAEGAHRRDFGSYRDPNETAASPTPQVDSLAARGVRFTHFRAPTQPEPFWQRLLTGRRGNLDAAALRQLAPATLLAVMWQGGYATHLIGDCSAGGLFAAVDPREFGFDDWFGIRDPDELAEAYPDQLETIGGAKLTVTDNANGQHGRSAGEVFTQAAKAQLARSRRGRPFFLLLVYSPLVAQKPDELDRHIGDVLAELEKQGLAKNTIVMLLGAGDLQDAAGAPPTELSAPAPAIVATIDPRVHGLVSDHPWAVEDLLPTLADATHVIQRPRAIDGVSAWSAMRPPPASATPAPQPSAPAP